MHPTTNPRAADRRDNLLRQGPTHKHPRNPRPACAFFLAGAEKRTWFLFETSRTADHIERKATVDRGILYFIVGIVAVMVVALGLSLQHERDKMTGISIDISKEHGITIAQKHGG
jgi:hypothetical protein